MRKNASLSKDISNARSMYGSTEWFEKAASGGDGMALKYLERLRDIMAN